jgi:hypothetical protein
MENLRVSNATLKPAYEAAFKPSVLVWRPGGNLRVSNASSKPA